MSALQKLVKGCQDMDITGQLNTFDDAFLPNNAAAELAYLRECERLLKIARKELAGTMFVTYETGVRSFREIVDELFTHEAAK